MLPMSGNEIKKNMRGMLHMLGGSILCEILIKTTGY